MKPNLFSSLRGLLMLVLLAFPFTACDTLNDVADEAEVEQEAVNDLIQGLSSDLELTDDESGSLRDLLSGYDREPGWLWYAAADLQQTLTAEQKERLFAWLDQSHGRGPGGPGGVEGFMGPGFEVGPGPHDGPHGPGPLAVMTDEQKAQVRQLRQRVHGQVEAIREQVQAGELTREDAHEQIKSLMEALRAEILAQLTDEQKAELERLREQAQQRWEAALAAEKAARKDALDLSDEAEAAWDALVERTVAEAQTIHEQVRGGELDREGAKAQLEALKDAFETELATILTETQLEIVKIHRALSMRFHKHKHDREQGRGHDRQPPQRGRDR